MSVSYWLDQSQHQSLKAYDAIIVGAGIAGASSAYWLKKEDPSLNVLVLDKASVAGGASGRNAGFITCGSVEHFSRLCERWGEDKALEIWRFSEENLSLLNEHIIQGDSSLEFSQSGTFSLAGTASELQELKNTAQIMMKNRIPVEVLSDKDVQTRLGGERFSGGIKYVQDASVNPVSLVQKILKLSQAEVLEHAEVHNVESQSTGVVRVLSDKGHFEAPIVILALNGFSATSKGFFKDKIFPTRGQIMVTEPVEKFMEGPCYANFVLDYFRQLGDGRVLIGGFRQLEKNTEVGFSDHVTDVIQDALYSFLQTHLPHLKNKRVSHRWAGVMGFSADGQPLVGSLPDEPNVFFHGGFTGHGLGLAFHTAKCLNDLIFGRSIPNFISARRF